MNFAFNSKAEEENSIFAKLNAENKLNSRNNLKNSFRESHRAVAFSEYSPVSSSQSLLQNFSPGTPETDFNGTSLEIDNFQNINNIYNISSAEKRSKYSVKTHFDRPEEEVESGLENDFSEGAGLDNRNFKRPFDTKLTRPSTLPITSCLELQVDMMDCKEVTPDNLNEFLEEGFQLISWSVISYRKIFFQVDVNKTINKLLLSLKNLFNVYQFFKKFFTQITFDTAN